MENDAKHRWYVKKNTLMLVIFVHMVKMMILSLWYLKYNDLNYYYPDLHQFYTYTSANVNESRRNP